MQEQTQIEKIFEKLYTSYYYKKVTVYSDFIVYHKIPIKYVKEMLDEIKQLIHKLELPLIANAPNADGIYYGTIDVKQK